MVTDDSAVALAPVLVRAKPKLNPAAVAPPSLVRDLATRFTGPANWPAVNVCAFDSCVVKVACARPPPATSTAATASLSNPPRRLTSSPPVAPAPAPHG